MPLFAGRTSRESEEGREEELTTSVLPDDVVSDIGQEVTKEPTKAALHAGETISTQCHKATSYFEASWFSYFTFSWMNPLMAEGIKRQVNMTDMPEFGAREDSSRNTHRLLRQLERMERAGKSHPLLRAYVLTFWQEILIMKLLGLAGMFIGITGPLLVQGVLVFQEAQNDDAHPLTRDQLVTGFLCVFGLAVKGLFDIVWGTQIWFYGQRVHYRIAQALRGAVLHKCVCGSKASKSSKASTPAVYNVISFDIGPNVSIIGVVIGIYGFPIQFALSLMVLIEQVQEAVVPGLIVLLVAKAIEFVLMAMDGVLRDRLMRAKDVRLQCCAEGFLGIRTLQMLAWVEPFQDRILDARKKELRAQKFRLWIKSIKSAIEYSLGTVITLVTLGYFVRVQGHELKASVAIPVISLINGLGGPLNNFPSWINQYLIWKSAYARVNDYMGFTSMSSRTPGSCIGRWKTRVWILVAVLALIASGCFSAFGFVLGWKGYTKLFWSAGWGLAWILLALVGVWLIDARQSQSEADATEPEPDGGITELRGCTLSWSSAQSDEGANLDMTKAEPFKLRDVELQLQAGKVTVLTGKAGQGKTSLLLSLLGETNVESGRVLSPAVERQQLAETTSAECVLPKDMTAVRDAIVNCDVDNRLGRDVHSVPYASQDATLFSVSIRENILFGTHFDEELYSKVITACALDTDLGTMPCGDRTLVVQGGANLSGGQKARIGIARAAYRAALGIHVRPQSAPAPVVLLDDPFCALDSKVAKEVCCNLFSRKHGGLLRDCVTLIATSDLYWLRFLEGEDVCLSLVEEGSVLPASLPSLGSQGDILEDLSSKEAQLHDEKVRSAPKQEPELKVPAEQKLALAKKVDEDCFDAADKEGKQEHRAAGRVRLHTYATYIKAVGYKTLSVLLLSLVGIMVTQNLCSLWVAYWTDPDKAANFMGAPVKVFSGHVVRSSSELYNTYAVMVAWFTVFNFLGYGLEVVGGVHASRVIFGNALRGTLSKSARWWDDNPTGRVLNRFSEDVETMDNAVTYIIGIIFGAVLYFIGHAMILAIANPMTLIFIPFVAAGMEYYARYYRSTIREVQRIWLTCMSTVYQDMTEAVIGRVTIRAFNSTTLMLCQSIEGLHRLQRADFGKAMISQWLGFRMSLLGWIVGTYTKLYPILQFYGLLNKQSAAMVGFSIHYSMETVGIIRQFIGNFSDLEMQLVSIERLEEYGQKESLADAQLEEVCIHGTTSCLRPGLHLEDVTVMYREGLNPALKSVSLSIASSEAVAVVGRTGAGKTTLLLSVLQMLPYKGSMTVDGQLLSAMDSKEVRRRLVGIVPQQPLLFEGSLRWNLDPEGGYADDDLWGALASVGLEDACRKQGLDSWVAIDGTGADVAEALSFSQSQRQLLCAARILMRRQRVVMLDEVTASLEKDVAINVLQSLVQTFCSAQSAVMVVTHQEDLLACCQRVITVAAGKVVDDVATSSGFDEPLLSI
eukprot:TRINITY_DN60657_c0_g1_i1.p1 TRINITY_DN60657_c0_g1~~TRINITY_DN60657_c0_g1_i1.p1  ORF type:complete len:1473 (-),score=277.35 TRINITY_DN60657_c0_g1_i1:35-4453(-)